MAFSLSDYRNIPSTGIIPDEMVPADQFSFAYTFIYEVSVGAGIQPPKKLEAHIVLEVLDGADNVKATFEAYESYSIIVGPLQLIWAWISTEEKFTGTDASGQPIETEGAFSLGVIPASGTEVALGNVPFSSTFYSNIFNIDLDPGDRLRIKFHNVSAGRVTNKASLKIATRPGGKSPSLFDVRTGSQFRVISKNGQTRMLYSRRSESPLPVDDVEWSGGGNDGLIAPYALKGASIGRIPGGATLVLGSAQSTFRIFQSTNEGQTWTKIMDESSSISILAACLSRDGSRYIAYGLGSDKKPAYAIVKNGPQGWNISESGAATGEELPTSKVNSLEVGEGGTFRLLATGTSGELLLFYSTDDGKTYRRTPA